MTNLPPSDPRRTDPRRNRDLGFDELLAMLIAFGAIGSVLWWSLGRNTEGFDVGGLLQPDQMNAPRGSALPSSEAASQAAGIAAAAQGNGIQSNGIQSNGLAQGNGIQSNGIQSNGIQSNGIQSNGLAQGNGQLPAGAVSPTPNWSSPYQPYDPRIPASPTAAVPSAAVVPAVGAAAVGAAVGAAVPAVGAASPPSSPVAVDTAPPPALVVPPPTASPAEFSDVPQDFWARPFIAALAQRGIVKGFADGTFRPDQPVTRSQYAALIETIFQSQTVQNPIAFKDVLAGFWAAPAIDTAVQTGFLKGYPEGVFLPNQPIPRIQVLTSLVNGLKISQPSAPADVVKRYRDSSEIPAWAVPVAAAATQKGMVVNYPDQDALNPKHPATRAEVSALLYQALVASGKIDPIQSSYIVKP